MDRERESETVVLKPNDYDLHVSDFCFSLNCSETNLPILPFVDGGKKNDNRILSGWTPDIQISVDCIFTSTRVISEQIAQPPPRALTLRKDWWSTIEMHFKVYLLFDNRYGKKKHWSMILLHVQKAERNHKSKANDLILNRIVLAVWTPSARPTASPTNKISFPAAIFMADWNWWVSYSAKNKIRNFWSELAKRKKECFLRFSIPRVTINHFQPNLKWMNWTLKKCCLC